MNIKILMAFTVSFFVSNAFGQHNKAPDDCNRRIADIGIVFPISTNGRDAAKDTNLISFQIFTGISGEVSACAIAGIGNVIKGNSSALALGGIFNITGNKTSGVQISGVYNQSHRIKGVQLAGVGNIAGEASQGVQLSGVFNRASVVHSQLSGLINIAGKVKGVQISGLLNIADSSDCPVGFINLINQGEKSIGLTIDEQQNSMLSFYSGGSILYGILGIGYSLKNDYHWYALQGGIGAHFLRHGKHFRLNAEALEILQTDFENGHCYTYSINIFPEIFIGKHILVFAGPSANLQLDYSEGKISAQTEHHFWTTTGSNGHFIGSYFGLSGGIKFIL